MIGSDISFRLYIQVDKLVRTQWVGGMLLCRARSWDSMPQGPWPSVRCLRRTWHSTTSRLWKCTYPDGHILKNDWSGHQFQAVHPSQQVRTYLTMSGHTPHFLVTAPALCRAKAQLVLSATVCPKRVGDKRHTIGCHVMRRDRILASNVTILKEYCAPGTAAMDVTKIDMRTTRCFKNIVNLKKMMGCRPRGEGN